jgi:hypothetical protein
MTNSLPLTLEQVAQWQQEAERHHERHRARAKDCDWDLCADCNLGERILVLLSALQAQEQRYEQKSAEKLALVGEVNVERETHRLELAHLRAELGAAQDELSKETLRADAFFRGREMMKQDVAELKAERERCPDWRCRTCGCLWRDNHDGTVSLFDASQKSCDRCEHQPTTVACEEVPPQRDADIPPLVRQRLMRAAVANGRISYWYLVDVYRQGRVNGVAHD